VTTTDTTTDTTPVMTTVPSLVDLVREWRNARYDVTLALCNDHGVMKPDIKPELMARLRRAEDLLLLHARHIEPQWKEPKP